MTAIVPTIPRHGVKPAATRTAVATTGRVILPPNLALLACHLGPGAGAVEIGAPARVRASLAGGAVGAEAGEVEEADAAADVFLGAAGAEGAEALVVVRAGRELRLRVDVEVEALLAVGAVAVAGEEVALGHLAEVVLVEELAVLALFAEAAEPVFAD